MNLSVGQAARLAHVSVRTLHHYDRIGLLCPRARTEAGYRVYGEAEMERLARILAYRELGLPLHQIAALLDEPDADPVALLRRQHALLQARIGALEARAAVVRRLMEARRMGMHLDPKDLAELFGPDDPTRYAEEAERRWGETDAWAESRRRSSAYGKEDWKAIMAEQAAITEAFATLLREGAPASGEAAMGLAERHRAHIERHFYPCNAAMHRNLGQMYVDDPRFGQTFDKTEPGLAPYVRDAFAANAARHGA
jgi:DNA-binding transcriptional MerR regulator